MIDAFCKYLRGIGLDANVESEEITRLGLWELGIIIGSVKIANRNVDLVEIESQAHVSEEGAYTFVYYRCNYVVLAKVEPFKKKLKAHTKLVRESYFFRPVDFKWKGKELAQTLNDDGDIKNALYTPIVGFRGHSRDQPFVEVKPYRKHQCIMIRPNFKYAPDNSPAVAYPTIETFETFDRIGYHIRNIVKLLL